MPPSALPVRTWQHHLLLACGNIYQNASAESLFKHRPSLHSRSMEPLIYVGIPPSQSCAIAVLSNRTRRTDVSCVGRSRDIAAHSHLSPAHTSPPLFLSLFLVLAGPSDDACDSVSPPGAFLSFFLSLSIFVVGKLIFCCLCLSHNAGKEWRPSLFCKMCIGVLIKSQWSIYEDTLAKATCKVCYRWSALY